MAIALLLAAPGLARAEPFVDLTVEAGLDLPPAAVSVNTLVAAVSVADVDGDGELDVLFTGGNRAPALFLRTGPLTWSLTTTALPDLDPSIVVHGHTLFDMDGDGDLDLLLLTHGRDLLFENLGDGTFADVTRARLPGLAAWSISAVAADLDGDGDLDLVVVNYIDRVNFPFHDCAHNRVLENVGGGVFHDRTAAWGLAAARPGCSFLAGALDLVGDRALDLLVVNDFAQFAGGQELWLASGPTTGGGLWLTERAAELGFVAPIYGMGLAAGVAPSTGRLEVALTNIGPPVLLEQRPDGTFIDSSELRGAGPSFAREAYQTTWAAEHEDLDGDGWPDLIYAGGHLIAAEFIENPRQQQHVWLRGGPDGRFVEVPIDARLGDANTVGRDLAVVDVDGDGRPDVFIAELDGRVRFYHNQGAAPPALRVALQARTTGPNAAGAQVTATCEGLTRVRQAMAGRFYGAAEAPPTLLFTFPHPCDAPGEPVALGVTWPSGFTEELVAVTGGEIRVEEPDWLRLEGQSVVVDLGAASGPIAWTGDGVDVSPAVEGPGGVWTATWAPTNGDGEGRLVLEVAGARWGVHPRVTWRVGVTPGLLTYPRRLVVDQPFDVFAAPRAADGSPLATATDVGLRLGGVAHPLTLGPDGWHAELVAPATPGAAEAELLVDGEPYGAPEMWPVAARVDPTRSRLEWRALYADAGAAASGALLVRAYLVDVNGALVAVGPEDVALEVNGGAAILPPSSISSGTFAVSVRFDHASLADGDLVRLRVHGELFEPPQRVTHLAVEEEAAGFVDPARSSCGFSEQTLRADGQQVGMALVTLRDAGGVEVPVAQLQSLAWSSELLTLSGPMASGPGSFRVPVVAGTTPGVGTISLMLEGAPGPVACSVLLVEPTPWPPLSDGLSTLLAVDADGALEVGLAVTLRIVPRTVHDRAAGSGAQLEVQASQGTVDGPVRYVGHGRYETEVTPAHAGTLTVTVTHADPPLTLVASWPVAGGPLGDAGAGDATTGDTSDAGPADGNDADATDDTGAGPTPDGDDNDADATHDDAPAPDTHTDPDVPDTPAPDTVEPDSTAGPDTSSGEADAPAEDDPDTTAGPVDVADPGPATRKTGSCASGPADLPPLALWITWLLLGLIWRRGSLEADARHRLAHRR